MREFNYYIDLNEVTNEEIKRKLLRSAVGRPIAKYTENQRDSANLTTTKLIFERIEARFKKGVNRFSERLIFRSSTVILGESLLEYLTRLNFCSKYCDFGNYRRDDAHL